MKTINQEPFLVKKIEEAKHSLIDRKICKDNKEDIVKILKDWTNQKNIDVIITTGGTGLTGRACAVLANGKYVFALPGSSGGVTDAWDGILKHQLNINNKPCNFVELFPRLKEK